ncbi:inositol polyphosphate multikinase [Etheostoma spectabile]|uniref:inositol polyphosphate multikinase n=1 Tax=Etheostoma spectabile TaxID=54343 RepID=UPI0013AEBC22|nr:inositol polyphosphate multikinase-like [Etheostoma spectabile]XP_032396096.1 inositol polyphosphate multikinase-like [Etheostoma spectabile]
MSTTQRQVMMESSLGLGRLELTPSAGAGGVSLTPRLSGGHPAKDKCGQLPLGPQVQAHLNGCVPLSHQVAGHKYGVDTVGILQHPDGTVLKQLQPPPRGPREKQFYSMVYAEDCCDPCLLQLQNHLPKYYGTWSSPDSPNDLYLKLEDVTRRFVKPCIMDVKLGQRSYDPFASQEKREQQIRKYPLMEEIGFLVLGMRVYKMCSDTFDSYDQHYGRGLAKDTIKDGLSKFFHNGVSLRKDAVSASISRVQCILRWFESQHQLAFYASSLLFVYEGLPSSSSSSSSSSLSSLLSTPPISPSAGKTAALSLAGDSGRHREGKKRQEGARPEGEVAEYNNNNIQVPVPWDYSLSTIYTNHRRGGHHHCAKGQLRGKSVDGDAVQTTLSPVSGDNIPALCEEDNSAWKRTGESQQPRNGNKSQLEGKDEDGEREGRGRREEPKGRGGNTTDGSGEDKGVEVRMIDFAHVFPSESHDHGYIYGLKNLLTVLEQILCDAA